MTFQNNLLQINNTDQVIDSLVDFIRKQVYENFKKKGVVIGLSGGIDSSVVAALCVKALGSKNVLGIIMPEKESNPQSIQFAQKLAKKFEISTMTIDITNILDSFDIYNIRNSVNKKYYSNFDNNCQYRIVVPQDLIERDGIGFPYLEIKERDKNILKIKFIYFVNYPINFIGQSFSNTFNVRKVINALFYSLYYICFSINGEAP